MASTIPPVMRGFILQNGEGVVAEMPTPTLLDDEVLIKVETASLNPTDWKQIKLCWGFPGSIIGCDAAGEIVKLGPNITTQPSLRVGDRVAGITYGGSYADRGAFAEYAKIWTGNAWKIPKETTYEEAVTFGITCPTAVQALFAPDRLALVEPPNRVDSNPAPWIFIYGGSSCVGYFAIQWAKLAGYRVATVSSPRNFELVKSVGADVVYDYNDPMLISKIKDATGDSIHHAFDAHSSEESQVISVKVLGPGTGKVIVSLPESREAQKLREDVTVLATWLYSSSGVDRDLGGLVIPASEVHRAHIRDLFVNKMSPYVEEGKLKPPRIRLWPGGLDSILDAMDYMADGKVSAEKIVFTEISDSS